MSRYFIILVFSVLMTACSKEDSLPDEEFFIEFKVDGKEIRYTTTALKPSSFYYNPDFGVYMANIQVVASDSDGTKSFMNIQIRNEITFQENKDYNLQERILISGVYMSRVLMTWADENGLIYNAVLAKESYPNLDIREEAVISFSKIQNDLIEGNFFGTLVGPVNNSNIIRNKEIRKVDSGKFRLKLYNVSP